MVQNASKQEPQLEPQPIPQSMTPQMPLPEDFLALGSEIMQRADALAVHTEVPGALTRTYLTAAHQAAIG